MRRGGVEHEIYGQIGDFSPDRRRSVFRKLGNLRMSPTDEIVLPMVPVECKSAGEDQLIDTEDYPLSRTSNPPTSTTQTGTFTPRSSKDSRSPARGTHRSPSSVPGNPPGTIVISCLALPVQRCPSVRTRRSMTMSSVTASGHRTRSRYCRGPGSKMRVIRRQRLWKPGEEVCIAIDGEVERWALSGDPFYLSWRALRLTVDGLR